MDSLKSTDDLAIFIRWNPEATVHLCLGIPESPVPQGNTAKESLDNLRAFCAKLIEDLNGRICVNNNHLFIVDHLCGPDYVDFTQSFPLSWGGNCAAAGISLGDAVSFWSKGNRREADARVSDINGFQ